MVFSWSSVINGILGGFLGYCALAIVMFAVGFFTGKKWVQIG